MSSKNNIKWTCNNKNCKSFRDPTYYSTTVCISLGNRCPCCHDFPLSKVEMRSDFRAKKFYNVWKKKDTYNGNGNSFWKMLALVVIFIIGALVVMYCSPEFYDTDKAVGFCMVGAVLTPLFWGGWRVLTYYS